MEIKCLDKQNMIRWDQFVDAHPGATFFHNSGWCEVIEKSFGHKTYFLYAEENGIISGILPLGHIRSNLFGNALISTPFCVYGGVIANSESALLGLNNAAIELANKLYVDYLELRNIQSTSHIVREPSKLYVTFRKNLLCNEDENLKSIPRKQRAMIRKGITLGLKSVVDNSIDRFYEAYSESVRNLGTPVYSKKYFTVLKKVFGNKCEVISIEKDGKIISSVMSFYFRNQVLPYYGGGLSLARELHANDFMYWEVMKRAVEKGITIFDFGRSKRNTGSYNFKIHWGFEPTPLNYEYELIAKKEVPNINPLNPKYKFFISCWKHLPVFISNVIGPVISRNIG